MGKAFAACLLPPAPCLKGAGIFCRAGKGMPLVCPAAFRYNGQESVCGESCLRQLLPGCGARLSGWKERGGNDLEKVKKQVSTDMTKGSPAKLICLFALPLLAGNVLQQFYNMVDSIVVGNFVGDAALAAVGTGFPVIFMLVSLFMGMSTGATVMISQYYGAGDRERMKKTIGTIYNAMMIGAIPLTVAGILLAGPLLRLMNVPEDAFGMARTYVMVVFAGVVGNLGYNVNAGILQGLGNSKTPLLFLSIACGMNVVLDLLFVAVFHWGVFGAAFATIIAQFCSWVFGILYINKHYPDLHIHPFRKNFDRRLFAQAMKLGIPSGIQQALFSVGIMVLQTLINRYDTAFIAGFQGANKLDTFSFMPVQSFSIAMTTYVGQNIGAGKMERVNRGLLAGTAMSAGVNVVMALVLIPLGGVCMRMFSQDPAVIEAGCAYLNRVMPFYFIFSFLSLLNAVMRGAGETVVPMVSTLLSLWLVRLPAAYWLADHFGRDNLFYCYAIGWTVGLLLAGAYYLTGRWKRKSLIAGGASV